jgi:hypothetical protein
MGNYIIISFIKTVWEMVLKTYNICSVSRNNRNVSETCEIVYIQFEFTLNG